MIKRLPWIGGSVVLALGFAVLALHAATSASALSQDMIQNQNTLTSFQTNIITPSLTGSWPVYQVQPHVEWDLTPAPSPSDSPYERRRVNTTLSEHKYHQDPAGNFIDGLSMPAAPTGGGDWDGYRISISSVISNSGKYRMWYDGFNPASDWQVGVAESSDGIDWVKNTANPVLSPGSPGEWDDSYRGQATVLNDGGLYKMWYSGGRSSGSWHTGYATSTNGTTWNVDYSHNPVLHAGGPGAWDEAEADGPAVLKDGSLYKMWYMGCAQNYTSCAIGYATSPDGTTWTKYASNPVLSGTPGEWDENSVAYPVVLKNKGGYQMWYWNGGGQAGYATSSDGVTWTKSVNNPVLTHAWDDLPLLPFDVLGDSNGYTMWMQGGGAGIGYATSPDGENWTFFEDNPVLELGDGSAQLQVNYAHDWLTVISRSNLPITITIADNSGLVKATQNGVTANNGRFRSQQWPWNPQPPDIQPGDRITANAGTYTTAINPIGAIEARVDAALDKVTGVLHVPWFPTLTVRCEVWVDVPPTRIIQANVSGDGGEFTCSWAGVFDLTPEMDVAIYYVEPDGDNVVNVAHAPWMRVNYAHDWVGGDYPAGHTFWITATDGVGAVKATALISSTSNGGWGGDGFETRQPNWSPQNPDLSPNDWIYLRSDDGYSNTIHVGLITGTVNTANDRVSGHAYAQWFTQTLPIICEAWIPGGGVPQKSSTARPDGSTLYDCQWDPATEWNMLPGHDVAVMYKEPDSDRIIDVYLEDAPDLWIKTWALGAPAENSNFDLQLQYANDGKATAHGILISATFEGGTYVSDTSGFPHTGSGTPGDPLVWQAGSLPAESNQPIFDIFVKVTSPASTTLTYTAQIDTAQPYFQWDEERKNSFWVGHIVVNDARLDIAKWTWTYNPAAGQTFVYVVNPCNHGGTASNEVVLTDTLPLSTTLVTWWSEHEGWSEVSRDNHLLVVKRPTLSSGLCSRVFIRTSLAATAWPGMQLFNQALVFSDNDLNEFNSVTFQHEVGEPHTNLAINKDWQWGRLVAGGKFTYEFSYHNSGNMPADDVLVTSTLPSGTVFGGSFRGTQEGDFPVTPTLVTSSTVVWDLGRLEAGDRGTFYIQLVIDDGAWPGDVLTHILQISSQPGEDRYDDNIVTWVDGVNSPGPNLRVSKDNYYWESESRLNYELRAMNLGTLQLNNLRITETYPVSTTFNGLMWQNHGQWGAVTHYPNRRQLVFELNRLNPGDTASYGFAVDLQPAAVGIQGRYYTNTLDAPIPNDVYPSDNHQVVVASTGPDAFIEKSLTGGAPKPGALLTYTVQFGNRNQPPWNSDPTASTRLTETLPAGATFIAATAPGNPAQNWEPQVISGNQVAWQWEWMGANTLWTFDLTMQLSDTLESGDPLTNTIQVKNTSQTDIDPYSDNNLSTLPLRVISPRYEVTKTWNGSAVAGTLVTYTVSVSNTGNLTGTGVALADKLPGGVTYQSSDGQLSGHTVIWDIASLSPHQGSSGWFAGVLTCTAGTQINNHSYKVIQSDQGKESPDGIPVSFTLKAPVITASFQVSPPPWLPDQPIVFTSTPTTNGTPLDLAWAFGNGGTASGSLVSHTFTLAGSYPVTLTVTDDCAFTDIATTTLQVGWIKVYLPEVFRRY